jgi:hypothetical protein
LKTWIILPVVAAAALGLSACSKSEEANVTAANVTNEAAPAFDSNLSDVDNGGETIESNTANAL